MMLPIKYFLPMFISAFAGVLVAQAWDKTPDSNIVWNGEETKWIKAIP